MKRTLALAFLLSTLPAAADIDLHTTLGSDLTLEYSYSKKGEPHKGHFFPGPQMAQAAISLPVQASTLNAVVKNGKGETVWSGRLKNFNSYLLWEGAAKQPELVNCGWYVITGQGYAPQVKFVNLTGQSVKLDFQFEDGKPGPADVLVDAATPAQQIDFADPGTGAFKVIVKKVDGTPQGSQSLVTLGRFYVLTNFDDHFVFTEKGLIKSPGPGYER